MVEEAPLDASAPLATAKHRLPPRGFTQDMDVEFRMLGFRVQLGYCPPQLQLDKHYIRWLYITLNRTPSIDCSWEGAVPQV